MTTQKHLAARHNTAQQLKKSTSILGGGLLTRAGMTTFLLAALTAQHAAALVSLLWTGVVASAGIVLQPVTPLTRWAPCCMLVCAQPGPHGRLSKQRGLLLWRPVLDASACALGPLTHHTHHHCQHVPSRLVHTHSHAAVCRHAGTHPLMAAGAPLSLPQY